MPPPTQKMRAKNNRRHIPAELVSEILLNLPTKSLLRFSSVSKVWNSIIFKRGFVKRHNAVSGHVRVGILAYGDGKDSTFVIPPAASSNNPTAVDATELVCPFVNGGRYQVKASCRELQLVRVRGSLYDLYLWNPFMRTYKQVPGPAGTTESRIYCFFGLGYESAVDDYKILKVPFGDGGETFELYSLRRDSWTSIVQDFPKDTRNYKVPCVVVSGKLHWLDDRPSPLGGVIISFDLSTERFGEVALPPMDDHHAWVRVEGMSVLKEMLCLSHCRRSAWDIWVMEEYGVARSWSLKFSIPCSDFEFCREPLYLYENGEVLVWVIEKKTLSSRLFVCDETSRREVDIRSCCQSYGIVFVYVDSLVAPSSLSQ